MKVVHISTYYTKGGAAIACRSLVEAQREAGIDAYILTQEEGDFPEYAVSTTNSKFKRLFNVFRLAWEKFVYLFYQRSKESRFLYSIANSGEDITRHSLVQDADIIHLHWINGGFISLKGIEKIIKLEKPIVWTLHDIWPFTGGCHIAGECKYLNEDCGSCQYLNGAFKNIISKNQFKVKEDLYSDAKISFVCPSYNHKIRATESTLLKNESVQVIPNIIPDWGIKHTKKECRNRLSLPQNKTIICFGAFNAKAENKGIKFLIQALSEVKLDTEIELVIFGKSSNDFDSFGYRINSLGFTNDKESLFMAYKASDIFISPSIEESFGLTVGEAMSVGTPVVAFNKTGVKDLIDHKKNGYLAEFKNPKDLARGIEWILNENRDGRLALAAQEKIIREFNSDIVSSKFIDFYESIMNKGESE